MSELKKLSGSEVSITGEIPMEQFANYRPQAIKNITEHIEIPGFRKGKVPENIIIQKFGEEKILYEMAELALEHTYPSLISEHSLEPLGRPNVRITKIAKGNPLGFEITVAITPTVKLPDYKKIAGEIVAEKEESIEISEKEVNEAVETIRKQSIPHKGGASELPQFNDEFVKKLGDYADVADFKVKLKEHLVREKTDRARSTRRMKIIDRILTGTEITVPKIAIEGELSKMIEQFKGDVTRMGASFEDYLKHAKKTEEDMRKEFTPDAEKRSKIEFILHKIASEEKITPSPEETEKEIAHILEHYKDADPVRTRLYVTNIITNEKVLRFLEGSKQ